MASLKVWVVIYPSITLFLYVFGEALAFLPIYIRTLILTVVLVPWMIFLGVPTVERVLAMISKNDKTQK